MIVTDENKVLKGIIDTLFPGQKQYENDVPKDFKRPCFIFIDPEDSTDTQELTRFMMRVTKNMTLYAFYKEDNTAQGDEFRRLVQGYLMREKKHLIPDSDRRYLTVEACTANTNKMECLIEFSIRFSRVIKRDPPIAASEPIRHIVNNIQAVEGGSTNAQQGENG